LKDLVRRDLVTPETAYMAALKKEDFEPLVSAEFLKGEGLLPARGEKVPRSGG